MNDDLRRAASLIKAGRKDEANAVLRDYLDINPRSADAYYLFALAAPTREYAIRHLQRAVALDPAHEKANAALRKLGGGKKPGQQKKSSRRLAIVLGALIAIMLVVLVVLAVVVLVPR